jgi:hypothetical protein
MCCAFFAQWELTDQQIVYRRWFRVSYQYISSLFFVRAVDSLRYLIGTMCHNLRQKLWKSVSFFLTDVKKDHLFDVVIRRV